MGNRSMMQTPLIKFSLMLVLVVGLVFINSCSSNEEPSTAEIKATRTVAEKGDTVRVNYIGILSDGTVFDKSKEGIPLEFILGGGQIISGFDKAVEGMTLNEEKRVTIKAKDAYGERDNALTKEFPRTFFSEDFKAEKGLVIKLQDQNGRAIPATIIDMNETDITVDLNHPLAGEELTFDIKLVGIQ